ncbi:hypothetical protein ABG79_00751 [Caloramator mitchellensis]|uniref:TIGR02677 family protein n=1 Tax=Caloramator mitchellensis TaxID=908809 RepID=A0A0R3K329_CALMK|nr:TIGR02677 family protein [Caloramator mitchellensis]KRQ87413.1 hypothetical protein ABG79_00751 [Caloramator mitchellensis]
MEITNKLLKQIDEVRYLTAENASRYRAIMRYFYLQYQKMKQWIYKEEIYEELTNHSEFSNYTMEQLKQDLDTLVQWKNLIPIQDTSKVSTLEEYKNKQFRYQISQYSVEIERLTITLENLHVETASLEPSLLEKIKIELQKFKTMINQDEKSADAWWQDLNNYFKRLTQNSTDYINTFNTLRAEEMMKTREFLIYKDKFIDYLRDFIKGLQQNAIAIESILQSIDSTTEKMVLDKIIQYESSIPRFEFDTSSEQIKDNVYGKWQNLKNWFLDYENHESEAAKLFDTTNDIIRKITRYASQISESRNSAANRKEEYKKLAKMFLECKDINEAHKLSSLCFGIFNTKHIKITTPRKTESINSSIYDEEPSIITLKPRIKNYKEKSLKSPIKNNSQRKIIMLEKIMKIREEEQKIINSYIADGKIEFANLPTISPHVRGILLRWLSKGINSNEKISKTETGRKYRILEPQNKNHLCTVNCEDGTFTMPPYVILFED